jgi:hypothetical protein
LLCGGDDSGSACRTKAGREQVLVMEGVGVATCDAAGTEYADGHVVVDGTRIAEAR